MGNMDDGQRHAGGLARRQPTAQREDVCANDLSAGHTARCKTMPDF